ncbi:cytochrome c oxidase subunit II [Egicoccus halophilus]|uniref:Cytochrome c oxidase subunit 2 n=1 Tax=Egicoccus halophilus TaxID=1670830 RepID=A0A8J3ABP4_9ACTN|nr:cytochrome c oxidase subunit II [Egicoccus halophilus]GGI07652.1 cytochrome c oxidase subunit 2 [Egicoccus halophilus]
MRDRTATRAATRRRTRGTLVLVLALGLVLSACTAPQSALDPAGPYAQDPHDLIRPVFAIALFVFVLVQGLIIYAVIKFRKRPDDDGSLPVQVHGNTRLEIFWTVVPALILAFIAVPTVQMIFSTMDEPDGEFLTVEVIGHRWWWEFYYPDYDIYSANEIVIPVDTPVRLEMTASDPGRSADLGVIHSFWIPAWAGKQDVVPGQTTFLNIQADAAGRYLGQCAEYCGLSHVNMRIRGESMEPADFEAWVENQQSPAVVPEDGLAAQGAELFGASFDTDIGQRSCAACHQIWDGEGARNPGVGPDLTHFASREEFAGAIFPVDEEHLREWLRDPPAMKPMQPQNQVGMPNLNLSEEEIDALVAYMLALE